MTLSAMVVYVFYKGCFRFLISDNAVDANRDQIKPHRKYQHGDSSGDAWILLAHELKLRVVTS
jgi:hypothetical protein